MKKLLTILTVSAVALAMLVSCSSKPVQTDGPQIKFTMSIDDPASHYLNIQMSCRNVPQNGFLVKIPMWAPGYYNIMNYPQGIIDFTAWTPDGQELGWHKQTRNGWLVENGSASDVTVKYKVWVEGRSVAQSSLSEEALFLAPNGVFMHPDGGTALPSELDLVNMPQWKNLVTGLKRLESDSDTLKFYASDFDVLYDSPMYWGNQLVESFDLDGHHYDVSFEDPSELDVPAYIDGLKKIITASSALMKDVPYDNYAFILMGAGGGGLEHHNSQASFLGYRASGASESLMSFMCHEYFHLYNVKSIRPLELGPFNYDGECYTNLLWLCEGGTVFYETRLLYDAGMIDYDRMWEKYAGEIKAYEQYDGKNHMTLARSSYDTWVYPPFVGSSNVNDVSFSYYNKGAAVAMLFDCGIRIISGGERSMDDVMRLLYNRYYKELGRGFTDDELNAAIKEIAAPQTQEQNDMLSELFDYIYTVKPLDYNRFLEPMGLHYDAETYSISKI